MFTWYKHLCEYYDVTPEKALELGTRSSGRKPDLPGSKTCSPVSDMTFEDIWDQKDRKSVESVFEFYKDQGAWSSFRQCVRHKDMEGLHLSYIKFLVERGAIRPGAHICEYGCGVAPFMTTLLKCLSEEDAKNLNMKITICDVDCEHFNFAKFRLSSIKEERGMKNIELSFQTITPNNLPDFEDSPLDGLFCFEVLEHVPSPVNVINNIKDNMITGGFYIENFIKHDDVDEDDDGPDLLSARNERDEYDKVVEKGFNLIHPDKKSSDDNPNITRIWQRSI